MVPFNRLKLNKIWFIVKPQTNDIWITTSEYIRVTYEWHPGDIRMTYDYMQVTYECHTSDIRVHKRHANDIRVHTSDIRVTYECIRVTYRLRISDIRVTSKYIRVTYGWHTSAYEWHTGDIRVHTSNIRLTYECIRVTYGWYTSDMQIASAKSQKARGASHQSAFMGSYLTISHRCLLRLHSRLV